MTSFRYKMQRIRNEFNGGCEMMNFLMETVVVSFTMGGIFGAVVAMQLKSSKLWGPKEALIYNNKEDHPKIRRG